MRSRSRKGWLVKRGRIFHACWEVDGKRFSKSTGEATQRAAGKKLKEFMEPLASGDRLATLQNVQAWIAGTKDKLQRLTAENTPPLEITEAFAAYEASPARPDSGPRTLSDYRSYFRAFILWLWENHPEIKALRDISPEVAAAYASHMGKARLSPGSFNKRLSFLRLMYKTLQGPAHLGENPFEAVRRKRVISKGRRELTIAELETVCRSASGELRILFAIGVFTGLRLGDAALLNWSQVDIQRRIITLVPRKVARRKTTPVTIPIHPSLIALLAALSHRKGDVLPETAGLYRHDPSALTKNIQAHFRSCGIETLELGTGKGTGKRGVVKVGFHSLRHSFVSLSREANAPLSVVESIVGHSNPTMTRLYSHTSEAAARAAVNALPALLTDGAPTEAVRMIAAQEVHVLAEKLTAWNWNKIKLQLLEL